MIADLKATLLQLFASPKYADNLNGVNLLEQLRAATAMELEQPSPELNAQVVLTINAEIISGKNCWDVADLLKKRLHSSKPHKQWLVVQLLEQVLRECSTSLASHRDDLLLEIARTWSRPAKPDTTDGKRTRAACEHVLLAFGEAGAHAKLTVSRLDGAWSDANNQSEHVADSCMSVPEPKMVKTQSHLTLSETRTLNEYLRQATDKDLVDPSEEVNAQIVQIINAEVAAGKDPKDIAELVRQRLHSHKPHKQLLAVHLVARVLRDCKQSLGAQQPELLEELVRTMMRPAKPESDEGKLTCDAAMEVLYSYGAAGQAAIAAVNRLDGAWGSAPAPHVDTQSCMAVPEQTSVTPLTSEEAKGLKEQLQLATAEEELEEPNQELNRQVAETVKVLIVHGKDPAEVAQLLQEELRSHKPRKQWLAVRLVGHVLADCREVLSPCQAQLLEEVAKVMIRPSKPESEEGKLTRQAAMQLLRTNGPLGNKAFVAANLLDGAWGSAVAPHVDTRSSMAVPESAEEVHVADAIASNVRGLVDLASTNWELLREVLSAQAREDAGASTSRQSVDVEFEDQLLKDLMDRAAVLRDKLNDQKSQLAVLTGSWVDTLRRQVEETEAQLAQALGLKK